MNFTKKQPPHTPLVFISTFTFTCTSIFYKSIFAFILFTYSTQGYASDSSSEKIEVTDIKLPDMKIPAPGFNPPPPTPPTGAEANHSTELNGVAPEVAYGWLKNGNIRFIKNRLRSDGQSQKDIQRLAKGQTPHSIILSCSDSRVPPEILFDQKLGEIFTVRNAGETLDSSSIASIEYALEHLGAKLIVILGHTSCGAVKAAFSTLSGGDAGSPSLNKLVTDIHPRLQEFKGQKPSANYQKESWANAKGIAQDLVTRSSIVAEKIRNHQAAIQVGLYQIDSGSIEWDNP